tara:strand:+ start:2952 stop:3284 length:333 start_codon:yes stop_codon:yes gene_type:complete
MNKVQFKQLIDSNNGTVIFKFTATWCNPCKKAAPIIDEYKNKLPNGFIFYEIDIDESIEVYAMLKSKKIVAGIPSIVAYYDDNDSFWPDECVSSSSSHDIGIFFNTIINH